MCYTSLDRLTVPSCAMPRPDPASSLTRAMKALQANMESVGPAVAASYTLTGAILLLGGGGYALDRRFDTAPAFVVTGLLLGVGAGLYHLAKIMWRR
jgi:F0F1-type ATP synthase assembly protein I